MWRRSKREAPFIRIGPPLGLAYLAAALESKGFGVEIIDCIGSRLVKDEIMSSIQKSEPGLVGITTSTPTLLSTLELAHEIKQASPGILIILGWPGLLSIEEEVMRRTTDIDAVVYGEGEETIVDLARSYERDEPLDHVAGICFRKNGAIKSNPARHYIEDLDALPFPARHLLPMEICDGIL